MQILCFVVLLRREKSANLAIARTRKNLISTLLRIKSILAPIPFRKPLPSRCSRHNYRLRKITNQGIVDFAKGADHGDFGALEIV
jgi:hypothetical protein